MSSGAQPSAPLPLLWTAWLVAVVFGLVLFLDVMLYSFPLPFLPQHLQDLGYSAAEISVAIALYWSVSVFTLGAYTMWSSSKYKKVVNRELVVGVAIALNAAGALCCSALPVYGVFLSVRCLQGMTSALSWIYCMVLLIDLFPSSSRGLGISIMFAGNSLGEVAGPVVGASLYRFAGLRAAFLSVGCFGVLVAVSFMLALVVHGKALRARLIVELLQAGHDSASAGALPEEQDLRPGGQAGAPDQSIEDEPAEASAQRVKVLSELPPNVTSSTLQLTSVRYQSEPAAMLNDASQPALQGDIVVRSWRQLGSLSDRVVLALSLSVLLTGGTRAAVDVILPLYSDNTLKRDEFTVGMLFAGQTIAYGLASVASGALVTTAHIRLVMGTAQALFAVAAALLLLTESIAIVSIMVAVMGGTMGCNSLCASQWVSDRAKQLEPEGVSIESVMAAYNLMWFGGYAAGGLLAGAPSAADAANQRLLLVLAGVSIGLFVVLFWNLTRGSYVFALPHSAAAEPESLLP